jgi:hypothetical protein
VNENHWAARNSASFRVRPFERVGFVGTRSFLISGKDVYDLFDEESPDDTPRFARLVARPSAEFVVATAPKDNPFLKFVLRNLTRKSEVEIVFVINQFGMPIPFNASTVDGTPIEINALRLPWEASPKELDRASE